MYATGIRWFDTKKALMLIPTDTTISGMRILLREIPAAFIARSSLLSPILPSVIIDAMRVANGIARGSMVQDPHIRNSSITHRLNPLPTSSSMYNHRNCITRMNTTMRKTITNGPKKEVSMNLSNFFKPQAIV